MCPVSVKGYQNKKFESNLHWGVITVDNVVESQRKN